MKFCYAVIFFGCILSSSSAQEQMHPRPQWTKANIDGLTIELMDPVALENMTFTRDGLVPITVGEKKGPITAPVLHWELESGQLRITTDNKQLYDEFTLISRDASSITVLRHNGKISKYKIISK